MLDIQDLAVRYGRSVVALRGVTLSAPQGSVTCVLGANGAGKTSLLRAVSGTLKRHRGEILGGTIAWNGQSLANLDAAEVVSCGVVQVPEGRRVFGRLTVDENLRAGGTGARSRAACREALHRVFDLFPVLAQRRKQTATLLSGGEQQMLAIGRALMAGPSLLLLDEPSLGLAPQMVARIADVIQDVHSQGTSVVLVEQNASMALAVSDMAYVLDVGAVSLAAPARELAHSDAVERLYLGHAEVTSGAMSAPTNASVQPLERWQR